MNFESVVKEIGDLRKLIENLAKVLASLLEGSSDIEDDSDEDYIEEDKPKKRKRKDGSVKK